MTAALATFSSRSNLIIAIMVLNTASSARCKQQRERLHVCGPRETFVQLRRSLTMTAFSSKAERRDPIRRDTKRPRKRIMKFLTSGTMLVLSGMLVHQETSSLRDLAIACCNVGQPERSQDRYARNYLLGEVPNKRSQDCRGSGDKTSSPKEAILGEA